MSGWAFTPILLGERHATGALAGPTLQAAELAVAAMAGLALLLGDNSVSQEDFVDVGCPESAV